MKTEQQTILTDQVFMIESERAVLRFRVFYPSELKKMVNLVPQDKTTTGRMFWLMIHKKLIRRTGNYKKNPDGRIEFEYETIK